MESQYRYLTGPDGTQYISRKSRKNPKEEAVEETSQENQETMSLERALRVALEACEEADNEYMDDKFPEAAAVIEKWLKEGLRRQTVLAASVMDQRNFALKHLKRACDLLGVDVDDFTDDDF